MVIGLIILIKRREGFLNVVKAGINAFFNFSPIGRNQTYPNTIYRSFHWGKDVDLFILDSHSYRDRNDLADTFQNNKTLLGKEQMDWLKQNPLNSKAIWKIISSSTPVPFLIVLTKSVAVTTGLLIIAQKKLL